MKPPDVIERKKSLTNAFFVIHPYRRQGVWMFDDPQVGIVQEPFVSGADVIIDRMVKDVYRAENGFALIFSASPFPGYQYLFKRRREEFGGYWYFSPSHGLEGWLCPVLFAYFEEAPKQLYAQVKPIKEG